MTARQDYKTWNFKIDPDLKKWIVSKARKEQVSIGNLVLRELGDHYAVPVELGQNRIPSSSRGHQLFIPMPDELNRKLDFDAYISRKHRSELLVEILLSRLNGRRR